MTNTFKLLIQLLIVLTLSILVAGGMIYMKNLNTRVVEETFASRNS